jgi:hypothetical protein
MAASKMMMLSMSLMEKIDRFDADKLGQRGPNDPKPAPALTNRFNNLR